MSSGAASDDQEGAGDDQSSGQWVQAFQQLFDPHPSQVALLDLEGQVLAVNTAWRRYGTSNGLPAGYEAVGRNYLAICEAGVAVAYPGASEAYVGLLDVLRNARPKFTLTYACHTPARREWYRMWVEPQSPSVAAVIVAHQLVDSKPWVADDAAEAAGRRVGWGGTPPVSDAAAVLQR